MPKELERKLIKEAIGRHLKGERKNAYVYGTLRKTGWVPPVEKKNGAKS